MLYYCTNLESVVVPSGVKSIGYYAFYADSKLSKVFFEGTIEDWSNITIDANSCLNKNAIIYCYSEDTPTDDGNYWHYVGGIATVW